MGTSLFLVAADAATQGPSNAVVVVTGLVLVFAILVLLMLIINLQGAIFTTLDKRKAAKAAAEREAALAAAAAVPKASAAAPAAAPVIEDGIPDEVVAAIAAAIASMDGGRYTLRSLTRKKEGRGAWSLAGVVSTTEPF